MDTFSPRSLDADGLLVEAPDAIFTFSGRTIRPLHPDSSDIAVEDIAHALSQNCRFTGHTRLFHSVAEHCVRVSLIVPEELALEALLHDASEAYLSDVARPIKRAEEFSFYMEVEGRLERAIAERFGLPLREAMEPTIRWADQYTLEAEVAFLHSETFQRRMDVNPDHDAEGKPWMHLAIPAPWSPEMAEVSFLGRYRQLGGEL